MSKKVLVCDDHYDFYEMLRFFIDESLSDYTVKVDFSSNGLDALLNTSKHKYDLIISDFKMPGMDGIEFINNLRTKESSQNHETPILMFSAYKPNLADLIDGEGSVTFMSKPFNSKALMDYVASQFND